MEIYGKTYGFKLTVGAACEIADRCPGGELRSFRELITGPIAQAYEGRCALMIALNRGFAEARRFETGEETPLLSEALLRTLAPATFGALFDEASTAFFEGLGVSVTVAGAKKNGEDAPESASP